MMEHNDELYLKQTVGNRNLFRVPEGYFEQLTEQVMNSLPDVEVAKQEPIAPVEQHRAKSVSMRPWLYAAACSVLALAMGVSYYFMQSSATSTDAVQMAAVSPAPAATYDAPDNSSYIDDAADYVMLDNTEIYAYLSENY